MRCLQSLIAFQIEFSLVFFSPGRGSDGTKRRELCPTDNDVWRAPSRAKCGVGVPESLSLRFGWPMEIGR